MEEIKKILILIFLVQLIIIQLGCKKDPTYNPFDKEFNISIKEVIQNGCDTIPAGCGYFNFTEKSSPAKMYYQVFYEDFFKVVAKGFVYHIDTFKLNNSVEYYELRDSLEKLPFKTSKLNKNLLKYNYSFLDLNQKTVRIVNQNIEDTISLKMRIATIDYNRNLFVRNLEYFVGSPKKNKN